MGEKSIKDQFIKLGDNINRYTNLVNQLNSTTKQSEKQALNINLNQVKSRINLLRMDLTHKLNCPITKVVYTLDGKVFYAKLCMGEQPALDIITLMAKVYHKKLEIVNVTQEPNSYICSENDKG